MPTRYREKACHLREAIVKSRSFEETRSGATKHDFTVLEQFLILRVHGGLELRPTDVENYWGVAPVTRHESIEAARITAPTPPREPLATWLPR